MYKQYEILGETINVYFEKELNQDDTICLFIHGFGSSNDIMKPIQRIGNRKFIIVSIDLPGCGKSSWNVKPISILNYMEITKEFINKYLLHNEVYIVAHSLGAWSGLYAVKNTHAKHALLLGPAHYHLTPNRIEFALKYLIPKTEEDAIYSYITLSAFPERFKATAHMYAKSVISESNDRAERFEHMLHNEMMNKEFVNKVLNKELYGGSNKYTIVVGEKDLYTRPDEISIIAKEHNKTMNLIPEAGHAIFVDQPIAVLNFINEMIENEK
ncbi:alpha/beta fold hydrolase [Mycoplasma phocoenae]|uniref:Alpha/beta hydrolase n=1 Tax=Mycoplasma phocoenae TaxID=754517 RepID=A0A858U7Y8_9MOLU|nr:alpha/beta hydrolase [Mycoplasma phocoenae]QJG66846.1 alpha/beta hydrolase [Mycoplasma phocoenae]